MTSMYITYKTNSNLISSSQSALITMEQMQSSGSVLCMVTTSCYRITGLFICPYTVSVCPRNNLVASLPYFFVSLERTGSLTLSHSRCMMLRALVSCCPERTGFPMESLSTLRAAFISRDGTALGIAIEWGRMAWLRRGGKEVRMMKLFQYWLEEVFSQCCQSKWVAVTMKVMLTMGQCDGEEHQGHT